MNTSLDRLRQRAAWAAFRKAVPLVSKAWRAAVPRLERRVRKRSVTRYDVAAYGFRGGELEGLTQRNYEKALRNIWKAEIHAPYLGIKDASKLEKAGNAVEAETADVDELIGIATSAEVKAEFEAAFTPRQRLAIGRLLSLIGHGEAYALYTSSTLLPVLEGTGAKLGMAMQAMEEAKHFTVLRAMLKTLGIDQPLSDSAYILFERIAAAPTYRKLFGMNVVLESFATTVFAQFADFPALKHIVHVFHMDEARHVGFPRSYSQAGRIPARLATSEKEKWARTLLVAPVLPLIWDYKEDFEAIGLDAFAFFGRVIYKVAHLAESVGLPFHPNAEAFVSDLNLLFNAWRRSYEPEKFTGYRDYTAIAEGDVRRDLLDREIEVFGDIFRRSDARPGELPNAA